MDSNGTAVSKKSVGPAESIVFADKYIIRQVYATEPETITPAKDILKVKYRARGGKSIGAVIATTFRKLFKLR
jgi:hypothetical protein